MTNLGDSVAIERNHTVIAQITPPQRNMTAIQALAGLTLTTLTQKTRADAGNDEK